MQLYATMTLTKEVLLHLHAILPNELGVAWGRKLALRIYVYAYTGSHLGTLVK